MPILFSYDLENAITTDYNRLQSMFERFGWERIGGSCFRYPTLEKVKVSRTRRTPKKTSTIPREDWLDAVIPALMCFRAYVRKRKLRISKFSIDSHVSTGAKGEQPRSSNTLILSKPGNNSFGEKNLRDWVNATTQAIQYK